MEPMREQLLDGEVKTILSTTFEIRAVLCFHAENAEYRDKEGS